MSHVLTVLSSTFPEGENFFVRSVAAVRDELTDPRLLADVEGFIGREQMHGREHQVLNDRLAEHGYPTRGIDSYVRGLYWVRERIQSRKVNLAFTARWSTTPRHWPSCCSPTRTRARRSAGPAPATS